LWKNKNYYCIKNFNKKGEFFIITFSNKAQNDFIEKGEKISNLFSNSNCNKNKENNIKNDLSNF
jgi:hypothetical protein